MMPPSKRSRCNATVSARDFFVSSSTTLSASAARSRKYALATSAATAMRTVSRKYRDATRSLVAARAPLRYLPQTSSSYDISMPRL